MYTTLVRRWNSSQKWQVCTVLLAVVLVGAGSRESRVWTSRDGRQVEAQLLKVEDAQVTLRREDGKEFTIPMSALSSNDVEYLSGLETQSTVDLPTKHPLDSELNAPGTSGSETRLDPMSVPPIPLVMAASVGLVSLALLLVWLRRVRPLLGVIACLSIGGIMGLTASLCIASYQLPLSRSEDVYDYALQSQSWSMPSSSSISSDELLKPLSMTLTGSACGLVLFMLSRLGRARRGVDDRRVHQIRCPNLDCQSSIPATAEVCFECGRHLETGRAISEPRFLDVPHPKAGIFRYRFKNQVLEVQRVKKGRPIGDVARNAVSQYTVLEVYHAETQRQWAVRQVLWWPTWLITSVFLKIITLGMSNSLDPFGATSRQRDTVLLRMEADSDIEAIRIVFPNGERMRSFVKLARRFMDVEIVYLQ